MDSIHHTQIDLLLTTTSCSPPPPPTRSNTTNAQQHHHTLPPPLRFSLCVFPSAFFPLRFSLRFSLCVFSLCVFHRILRNTVRNTIFPRPLLFLSLFPSLTMSQKPKIALYGHDHESKLDDDAGADDGGADDGGADDGGAGAGTAAAAAGGGPDDSAGGAAAGGGGGAAAAAAAAAGRKKRKFCNADEYRLGLFEAAAKAAVIAKNAGIAAETAGIAAETARVAAKNARIAAETEREVVDDVGAVLEAMRPDEFEAFIKFVRTMNGVAETCMKAPRAGFFGAVEYISERAVDLKTTFGLVHLHASTLSELLGIMDDYDCDRVCDRGPDETDNPDETVEQYCCRYVNARMALRTGNKTDSLHKLVSAVLKAPDPVRMLVEAAGDSPLVRQSARSTLRSASAAQRRLVTSDAEAERLIHEVLGNLGGRFGSWPLIVALGNRM